MSMTASQTPISSPTSYEHPTGSPGRPWAPALYLALSTLCTLAAVSASRAETLLSVLRTPSFAEWGLFFVVLLFASIGVVVMRWQAPAGGGRAI